MRTTLLFIFISFFSFNYSYSQTYEWTRQMGDSNEDYGRSLDLDPAGNVVSVGTFYDTLDIDPGPGVQNLISGGYQDTYIQKLDPNGNLIWAGSLSGSLSVVANEVMVDDNGYIYLTGSYRGTVDFDPGPGTFNISGNGLRDSYVAKLDPNGNLVWAKSVGGSSYERSFGLAVDSEGSVYTCGYFTDVVDFDPNAGVVNHTATLFDAYVLKLDSLGDFEWVHTYANDTLSFAQTVGVDINDNVIVGGYFAHTMDFDPGPNMFNLASNGGNDMFVHKMDTDGNHIWALSMGGNGDQSVRTLTTDNTGDIYITGGFEDTVDFDPGPGTDIRAYAGDVDIFLTKITSGGIYQWTQTFGTQYGERIRNIVSDTNGYIYVTGDFSDTLDFDHGPGVYEMYADTNNNFFAMKLKNDGTFQWAESAGGPLRDNSYDIAVGGDGSIYLTGYFQDTVDFDPGPGIDEFYGNGNLDAYVVKFTQCVPSVAFLHPVACNEYVSPSGNSTWYVSGNYSDTLYNSNVCGEDSIIYISLTVNTVDTGISMIDDTTLEASATGVQYQWLDCGNGYATIAGATSQTFTPTQNGIYAVQVTGVSCTDTSECMSISVIGIEELTNEHFVIYPNPTRDHVTIRFNKVQENVRIEILNLYGQIMTQKVISGVSEHMTTLDGDSGVYFVRVTFEDGTTLTEQLVKY